MIVHPLNSKFFNVDKLTEYEKNKLFNDMSIALLGMMDTLEEIKDSKDLKSAQLLAANQLIREMCR